MDFDDHVTQAFDTLTEHLRNEIEQEVRRRTAEIAAAAPVAAPEPAPTVASPAADDPAARLLDAFNAIDRARSLTAILDALIHAACAEAPAADLWLLRGGGLDRWRATASDEGSEDAPPPGQRIPITIDGQTVAVLVAAPRTAPLDLLARYASRSLESMTAFRTARALTHLSS